MLKKYEHIIPILLLVPIFIYLIYSNLLVASKKVLIDQEDRTNIFYNISAESTSEIRTIADALKLNSLDKYNDVHVIQNVLDYVTNIPYKVHNSRARKPINTINKNYGDCDDKSNLLSSLLNSLEYENYIVLVPHHAFVIVHISDDYEEQLLNKKALYLNNKKFYILETTAKNSKIAFKLKYNLDEINVIVNPIDKEILDISELTYK